MLSCDIGDTSVASLKLRFDPEVLEYVEPREATHAPIREFAERAVDSSSDTPFGSRAIRR
jgi:hypothetical protein